MELIGKEVRHISFGKGIVESYENGKISINFESGKSKHPVFQFPQSFEKYLSFVDESDQKMVDGIIWEKVESERLKQEQEQKERETRERIAEEELAKAAEEEKNSRLKKYNTEKRYNEKRFLPLEDMLLSSFSALRDKYLAGGYKPNMNYPSHYENYIDQNIYILRYIYAYTYEYQKMFEDLLHMWAKKDEIRMLSVGCGSMLDAWSMQEALAESGSSCRRVIYQGLDINEWNPSIDTRENFVKKMPLRIESAGSYFRNIDKLDYDVYCFPKSIGDIAGADRQSPEYNDILNAFRTKPICKNEVYIAASMIKYSDDQMPDDTALVDSIKEVLEERGYRCSDIIRRIGRDTDGSIIGSGYEMTYPIPNDLIEMLAGQNPTFLRRYEKYYIYKFVRGDKS